MSRLTIDFFVLDALCNDIESVEDVLRMVNSDTELGWTKEHGRAFTRDDIVTTLLRLIKEQLVFVAEWDESERSLVEQAAGTPPIGSLDDAYYGLSPRGRLVHKAWCDSDAT